MFEFIAGDAIPRNIWLVGCGGTGSRILQPLMQMLASRRIPLNTNIFLIDGDTVEQKNCARQLFLPDEVGDYKACILADRYHELYPHITLIPVTGFLTIREVLKPFMDSLVVEEYKYVIEAALGITDVLNRPEGSSVLSDMVYGPLYATYLGVLIKNARKFMPQATNQEFLAYLDETFQRMFGVFGRGVFMRAVYLIQYFQLADRTYEPPEAWGESFRMMNGVLTSGGLKLEDFPEWAQPLPEVPQKCLADFYWLESAVMSDVSQEELLDFGVISWLVNNFPKNGGPLQDIVTKIQMGGSQDLLPIFVRMMGTSSPLKECYRSGYSVIGDARKKSRYPRPCDDTLGGTIKPVELAIEGFSSPDIIILAVDSPSARKDILSIATLLTKDTVAERDRKILVVDPGNEDTFGQVSVTTLGRKLPIPIMDSFVPEAEKRKFSESMSTIQYMPEVCSFIGSSVDIPGQIKEFLETIPTRGFFTNRMDFLPWSPFSFLLRKKSEVAVSCAGMDQTLAINNVMASMSVSALQNSLFQSASSMETSRFSLVSSIHGQSTDIPWFRRKMGEGSVEETSIAYMGETRENLILVYRCHGTEHLDIYDKTSMECIHTTAENPMFQRVLQAMYENESCSPADILNAKIIFVSLVAGVPYPKSITFSTGCSGRQFCGVVPMRSAHANLNTLSNLWSTYQNACDREYEIGKNTASHLLFLAGVLSNPPAYSSRILEDTLGSLEVYSLGYQHGVSAILENAQALLPEVFTPDPLRVTSTPFEVVSNVSLAIAFARLNTLSILELVRKKGGIWESGVPPELCTRGTLLNMAGDAIVALQSSPTLYLSAKVGPRDVGTPSHLSYMGSGEAASYPVESPYTRVKFASGFRGAQRVHRKSATLKALTAVYSRTQEGARSSLYGETAPVKVPVLEGLESALTRLRSYEMPPASNVLSQPIRYHLVSSFLLKKYLVLSEFTYGELQRVCGNADTLLYVTGSEVDLSTANPELGSLGSYELFRLGIDTFQSASWWKSMARWQENYLRPNRVALEIKSPVKDPTPVE